MGVGDGKGEGRSCPPELKHLCYTSSLHFSAAYNARLTFANVCHIHIHLIVPGEQCVTLSPFLFSILSG